MTVAEGVEGKTLRNKVHRTIPRPPLDNALQQLELSHVPTRFRYKTGFPSLIILFCQDNVAVGWDEDVKLHNCTSCREMCLLRRHPLSTMHSICRHYLMSPGIRMNEER